MTISTTQTVATFIGNGTTTLFTYSFVSGGSSADLQVLYTDAAGITVILSPSVYTLVINAVPVGGLWGIGGSVTYPISGTPLQVGTSLTIQRIVPYEQTVTISNQGAFYPQVVEQALDLLELQLQQLNTQLDYTLQFPLTDTSPPNVLPSAENRANGYLGFDDNGQPIIVSSTSGTIGFAITRKVSTTGTATLGMTTNDAIGGVSVYQSSTPVTSIQLPSSGGPYPIFDGSLNAGTYPIKVLPPSGLTILGQSNYLITFNGQSATFYNDGTQILIG